MRRAETTVELPSGGSMAIGGLIQQQTKQNLDAFPGLKDLPVLGALFRSRDFENDETELVVTITAYLVNPVAPNKLAGPDDGFAPATDIETILFGRLNAVYGKDAKLRRPTCPRTASVTSCNRESGSHEIDRLHESLCPFLLGLSLGRLRRAVSTARAASYDPNTRFPITVEPHMETLRASL